LPPDTSRNETTTGSDWRWTLDENNQKVEKWLPAIGLNNPHLHLEVWTGGKALSARRPSKLTLSTSEAAAEH